MTLAIEEAVSAQALVYLGLGLAALAALALVVAVRPADEDGDAQPRGRQLAGSLIPLGAVLTILGSVLYLVSLYLPDDVRSMRIQRCHQTSCGGSATPA